MTPPTPPSGNEPSIDALRAAVRSSGGLILRTLLWAVAVALAASVGGPLAIVGLSGVALLVALGLVLLGATSWRRAGLPLSLCAGAVALSAATIAAQPVRVQLTHGLLVAKPKTPKDVERSYRRGVGNVLVDLRDFRAPTGSTTTINARSDTGRVVVALPTDRCFRLDVELAEGRGGGQVLFRAPLALARTLSGYRTGTATLNGQEGAWSPSYSERTPPRTATRLIAYGRTMFIFGFGGDQQPFSWRRPAPQATAPRLVIRADVATDLIVRDYPKSVGPAYVLGEEARLGNNGYSGEVSQVSDLTWPEAVQLPPSPGDRRWRDRWRPRPPSAARARRQRTLWGAWFNRARAAAQRRSALGAGNCASNEALGWYWSRFGWNGSSVTDGGAGGAAPQQTYEAYTVVVNGRGEARLYRETADGSPPQYILLRPGQNPFTNPAILKELA